MKELRAALIECAEGISGNEDVVVKTIRKSPEPEVMVEESEEETSSAPAPAPLGAGSTASSDVDSKGVPYNPAIHSSSKAKNKDGTWRTRRNLDAKVAEVETNSRAPKSDGSAPPPFPPMAALPQFAQAPGHGQVHVQPAGVVGVAPTAPIAPATPMAHAQPAAQPPASPAQAPVYQDQIAPAPGNHKPAYSEESFKANFIPAITHLIQAGKIDQAWLETLKKHFGVAEIWDVAKDDVKCKQFYKSLVEYQLITAV